jgi:uncharacterized protein (TIGR02265 family)
MFERALDLVGAHCDLEQRLRDIPPIARARGIWVRPFESALGRRGRLQPYLDVFGGTSSPLSWHPCGEIAARLAVAGALYASPAEVLHGMRELGRAQAVHFSESLLGSMLLRILSPDPVRVLQQGAAARRQGCSYGSWQHDFSTPGKAVVTHRDEYLWLDSQVLGSAEGTFAAIRVPAKFELHMTDAYNGVIEITWADG